MEEIDVFPDKYWHCHVELSGDSKKKDRSAIFNDLTFDELSQKIITPWHSGRAFTVDGMIIKNIDDIQKIKITNTPHPKSYYAEHHNNKMRSSGIADIATDRRLLPLSSGKDYTHDLLFKEQEVINTKGNVISGNNNVFIVHGHDEQAKESSARFIEKLGLNAVILHEQANEGLTIIEKLEKHTDAAYALVLFTPDDVGASSISPEKLQSRARQNVLVELGYMAAKIGRNRVCVLRKGNVEMPSDFLGVLYIDVDAAGAWRLALAKELKVAGLKVDLNDAM
ncbi:MAG: TIR domain-containing protein [Aeromonadaceae bacterium]